MLARTWLGYELGHGWVMRLMLAGTWLWDSCWLGHGWVMRLMLARTWMGYETDAGWDMDGL